MEIHRLWDPVCPSGIDKQSFGRGQEVARRMCPNDSEEILCSRPLTTV